MKITLGRIICTSLNHQWTSYIHICGYVELAGHINIKAILGLAGEILLEWIIKTDLQTLDVWNTWFSIIHKINLHVIYHFFQTTEGQGASLTASKLPVTSWVDASRLCREKAAKRFGGWLITPFGSRCCSKLPPALHLCLISAGSCCLTPGGSPEAN